MIAEYTVKRNGKWYQAGDEIGEETVKAVSEPEHKAVTYTKADINRMDVDTLRELAVKNDVPGSAEMTGKELKQYFIDLLGL